MWKREGKGEELVEEISQPERASERWEGSSALTPKLSGA